MMIQNFIAKGEIVKKMVGKGRKMILAQQSGQPSVPLINRIVEGDDA